VIDKINLVVMEKGRSNGLGRRSRQCRSEDRVKNRSNYSGEDVYQLSIEPDPITRYLITDEVKQACEPNSILMSV
jgi:hypothetical protein